MTSAVEALLAEARARIRRVTPHELADLLAAGALVVDTRPVDQRTATGLIPGSLVIDRNVLEWRLDPTSPWRHPSAEAGRTVVVVCQEGYSSSLAAATLVQLGLHDARDLDGGFLAWLASGLPVIHP